MKLVDDALGLVKGLLLDLLALVLAVFVAIEAWAGDLLLRAGLSRDVSNIVLVVLAVLLLVAALRLFGGLVRVLLIVFLVLLVLHILLGGVAHI